ncbi:hypothetical protein ROA7745_03316 [Roseovarius aestuarii]|uniref:Uncharacterized protein n=2 Tax=Roseovarius aestuarii TaxID=475083 RepID=A0A1X7BUZ5_9RHOB|nr:hypothetical protein ROA7745_03316 [Roseovarius aestuarii]
MKAKVTLAEFVGTFYTTPLFKAERLVLRCVGIRSSDHDARQLAEGASEHFAAWQMTVRTETELLMKAIGRTSSWFGIEHVGDTTAPETRLLFGSVVAPKPSAGQGIPQMGPLFSGLLGAHRTYSKLLLMSARRRING